MNNIFFSAYVECALWSSMDDNGIPLDSNYYPTDISEESQEQMQKECEDFLALARELIESEEYGGDYEKAGCDFWLTRNSHGAGFWDRGCGEVGKKLTEISHSFGSSELYIGDDSKLHIS